MMLVRPHEYYVSNLPALTPLKDLVETGPSTLESGAGYQQLKEDLGLGHFEGHSWRGLHHHLENFKV